ncbi:MAG: dTMP kinase [Ignavibacteriae bacterium]|nr:dTMP kinase [Ignavibacteriota bacterium]
MFITFEGIDLCGKSTQIKLLYDYFVKNKKKAVLVREPGGTMISEKIREILLDKKNSNMKYLTEFLLFSASRHQLTEEIIKPLLKKKYIVLCDRYYDSSTAYQGYGGKIDLGIINRINKIATNNLIPDLSFLIDINYEENIKRRKISGKSHDRIEQKEKNYYKKVISGYRTIAKLNPKRFRILDGKKNIEVLHKEILYIINKTK